MDRPREVWTLDYPAQLSLLASQTVWTEESEAVLEEFENGAEDAIKKYHEICTARLEALIKLVIGELSKNDRNKVITCITIDVHNRDIIGMLVDKKVESAQEFAWQSQMRYYWDGEKKQVDIKICDKDANTIATDSGMAGIRTIEVDCSPDTDDPEIDGPARHFTFIINGVPVFARGANLVPQSMLPGSVAIGFVV